MIAKRFHPNNQGNRKGVVLLFVLAILALLSLLGTALVYQSQSESKESSGFLDKTRADFAAESGIELACAKILEYKGALHQLDQSIAYAPKDVICPMEYTTESSFGQYDLNGDGLKEIAGYTSETYSSKGDRYKLRVDSCQSKININDSNSPLNIDTDPFEDQWTPDFNYMSLPIHLRHPDDKDPDWIYPASGQPTPKAPGRLENLLAHLIDILLESDAVTSFEEPKTRGALAAQALFRARKNIPNDSFGSMQDVRNALVPAFLNDEEYAMLEQHMTLRSWQDKNVLLPTFQWRINTPPRLVEDNPLSSHREYWPGDCVGTGIGSNQLLRNLRNDPTGMIPRPGLPNPLLRGNDILQPVIFDFDSNGELSQDETVYHHHDIYLYSDMQTRYFDVEARSPIDLNSASLKLLEALIAPVQGWYLKEAPSLWDGENLQSRAEDWSQATFNHDGTCLHIPWGMFRRIYYYNFGSPTYVDGLPQCDELSYYYYDSYEWAALSADLSRPSPAGMCVYPLKNKRFGELCQSKAFSKISGGGTNKRISEILALAIHHRIHPVDASGNPLDSNSDGIPDYRPFQTWEEFEYFLIDLTDALDAPLLTGKAEDFDIYMAHALIANFNPSARINDFNPDKRVFLHVDKSQLIGYSAELCFHPMGIFQIESLGQVNDSRGLPVAATQNIALTETFSPFKVSTQAQFFKDYDPASRPMRAYISEAADGENPCASATATYGGYSLQSYPEPETALQNLIRDSQFDGQLMLSTWQPNRGDLFSETVDETANNVFYADYDQELNAKYAFDSARAQILSDDTVGACWMRDPHGIRAQKTTPNGYFRDSYIQLPASLPGARSLTRSLNHRSNGALSADLPGNLYPDGAYSDAGRGLKYSAFNIGQTEKYPNELPSEFQNGKSTTLGITLGSNDLRIVYPRPGYFLKNGSTHTIKWELLSVFSPTQTVTIKLRTSSPILAGHPVYTLATNVPIHDLQKTVSIPAGAPESTDMCLEIQIAALHSAYVNGLFVGPAEPESYTKVNLPKGRRGSLQFWIKPGFDATHSNRIRKFFNCDPMTRPPFNGEMLSPIFFARDTQNAKNVFSLQYFSHGGPRVPLNASDSFYEDLPFLPDEYSNWIPTRAFFLQAGEPLPSLKTSGMTTGTVNHSWKYDANLPGGTENFQMETRQWNHIGFSWDFRGPVQSDFQRGFCMAINGQAIEQQKEIDGPYAIDQSFPATVPPWVLFQGLHLDWVSQSTENYVRFGGDSSSPWNNYVADSTYDDIVSSVTQKLDPALALEYQYGRYYSGNDAAYTSPAFDPFAEMELLSSSLSLHSIEWTAYWPLRENPNAAPNHPRFNGNRSSSNNSAYVRVAGIPAPNHSFNPMNQGDPMSPVWGGDWIPFSVDVLNPATGIWRYAEELGLPKEQAANFAGGSMDKRWLTNPLQWMKTRGDKFRFRVHLNIQDGQTLFTSPVFDDITFYFSLSQPRILYWEKT